MVNPEPGFLVQTGLLKVRTGPPGSGQFLVGNISSSIERCGRVQARGQIATGDCATCGETGKQESQTKAPHSFLTRF
jgi:hypothetical protein